MIRTLGIAFLAITCIATPRLSASQQGFGAIQQAMARHTINKGLVHPKIETSSVTLLQDWDLELRNRSLSTIYCAIEQSGQSLFDDRNGAQLLLGAQRSWWRFIRESSVRSVRIRGIDLTTPLLITIFAADTGFEGGFVKGRQLAQYEIIPSGKKIFLTWEHGTLRPQTGTFGGTTQSGIVLPNKSKRVESQDISKRE